MIDGVKSYRPKICVWCTRGFYPTNSTSKYCQACAAICSLESRRRQRQKYRLTPRGRENRRKHRKAWAKTTAGETLRRRLEARRRGTPKNKEYQAKYQNIYRQKLRIESRKLRHFRKLHQFIKTLEVINEDCNAETKS